MTLTFRRLAVASSHPTEIYSCCRETWQAGRGSVRIGKDDPLWFVQRLRSETMSVVLSAKALSQIVCFRRANFGFLYVTSPLQGSRWGGEWGGELQRDWGLVQSGNIVNEKTTVKGKYSHTVVLRWISTAPLDRSTGANQKVVLRKKDSVQ